MLRIILSLLLFISPVFLPWWLVIIFGLFLVFYFNLYLEFVVVGIIMDALYGQEILFLHSYYIFSICNLIIFLVLQKLKSHLRY